MITLRELGTRGLRERIDAQDRAEMMHVGGTSATDVPGMRSPSSLGVGGARSRKIEMAWRVIIDHEEHVGLILAEVQRKYNTAAGRQQLGKHVDVTRNVLRRTANALAVAYDRPPVRTFEKGARKLEKAWRSSVMEETSYNMLAKQWARYAWICNVVFVLPQVHDGQLIFEEVLPHAADVIFDAGERTPSILVYLSAGDGWARVAVDNERYWYLDDQWKVVRQFEHGYKDLRGRPMQPWVEWRTSARLGSMDFWMRGVGRQLVDTTLKVGVVNAALGAKRQAGDSKQSVLTADNVKQAVAPGQSLGGEHPVLLQGGELSVVDLMNPVKDWHEQMDGDIEALAESYGVTRGAVDKSKSLDRWAEFTDISKHREKQIPSLARADRMTSIKAAIIMRAEGHRDAAAIDPAKVADKLKIQHQAMTFLERPKDRMEFYALERSQGLASHVDQRMREHPDEDRPTALAAVRATIEERNEFSALLAARQLPADAGQDADNLAQLEGRDGGMTRAANSNPDGNEDDGNRDQPRQ